MDSGPLVKDEVQEGGELIRGFEKYYPVKVAFWLKASDDDRRRLYIASDAIHHGNVGDAYLVVLQLVRSMNLFYLDPFRVKVVPGDDRLVLAAHEHITRFGVPIGTRINGGLFGGITVDDVYIYPINAPAAVS